jgi:ABC-type amino acid transport substrate-binding protein
MKKLSKIVLGLLIGTVLTCTAGCTKKTAATSAPAESTGESATVATSSASTTDAFDEILKRGKLVVATELGTPPFAYKDPKTGKIDGLAIEYARMLADELGVDLEIKTFEWSGIIPSLLTGQVDMLTTCLTRTTERAGKMAFIEPFVSIPAYALVRKGTYKTLAELNDPKVTLVTTSGGVYEQVGAKVFPKAQMKTTGTNADNAVALQTKRADAYLNDKLQLVASMKMYPDQFEMILDPIAYDSLAFAVRFDSPKLEHAANMFFRLKKMDGTYQKVYKKWMGYDYKPVFEVGS